jgi:hypothetical protein
MNDSFTKKINFGWINNPARLSKKNMILILFLLPLFVGSCIFSENSCIKVKLTKEEKSWFYNYKKGQRILYKSNLGKVDTFTVTGGGGDSYTTCAPFELGKYEYNTDGFIMQSSKCHGTNSFNCCVNVIFTKEGQKVGKTPCDKRFRVFDLNTPDLTSLDSIPKVVLKLESLNKTVSTYFFDVGKFVEDNDFSNNGVKSFNWNKEHGLVQYSLFTGEVYTFWKKY